MATSAPTHHRKIDLQSAADLAYLQRNIHAAARQKIDLHFPPSAAQADGMGGGDSLRGRVEEIVNAFITQTLRHARQNITVNGLDLPPPSTATSKSTRSQTVDGMEGTGPEEDEGVEYEPYDARLASKLQSLYLALESETMAVARLRREAPRRAAEGWRARFLEGEEERESARVRVSRKDGEGQEGGEDGEKMEVDSEQAVLGDVGVLGDLGMGLEGVEGLEGRWEGVRGMYAVACEGLVGLKAGMTETVGRCERAERVVAEVERG